VEAGRLKVEAGRWKLEDGSSKMEAGRWKLEGKQTMLGAFSHLAMFDTISKVNYQPDYQPKDKS
jgi:hypothetical protein